MTRQRSRRIANRRAWVAVCGICMLTSAGCGGGIERRALEGRVTLDEEPLSQGVITFRPMPGTPGPTAGGEISEGEFSISPGKGTFEGKFRVEITASRKTGKKIKDMKIGAMVDEYEQLIPQRYNSQSELTADVTADGENRFEFTLSSQ